MDSVYRDVLSCCQKQASLQDTERQQQQQSIACDQSGSSLSHDSQSADTPDLQSDLQEEQRSGSNTSQQRDQPDPQQPAAPPVQISLNQPIGSLCGAAGAGLGGPLTVRGKIKELTDEEILQNREPEEGIRRIPRFTNYQPGNPSKVLSGTVCFLSNEANNRFSLIVVFVIYLK